ncbi:alpha-L-arabinofuranosidase C-terminal domain-containing protein [Thalassotalea sp. ND16A]|uniref:alpha-L-arabinofuranosidase C-terminal domain-containing protein n=1 Tax=Thalassotalea sp. ND16A TaxID=1535422 RepID=UPI00051D3FFB|nr:alpha-L-arabinofuranosidase C-terminal domain-containing protein [Thalassotalea sp. ND16A]KGK00082.1 hypothetical protein ND16A_0273 [Thalassotalea sp. ND16A]
MTLKTKFRLSPAVTLAARVLLRSVPLTCALLASVPLSLAAKDMTARVDVDLSHKTGKQNPYYYGGNNIYPKGAQGLMDKNGEFNTTKANLASQLGLRTYRFPGGSEGNLYKWKRAIGPLEQRIDNVSGNNRGSQTNEFGSDEFGRLLETTAFKHGIIMVAYGYEKPDDAADWVEYMNAQVGENPNGGKDWAKVRADNGHAKPYNIKYWEIGNEVYGNWELNWGSYPNSFDAKRGAANVELDTAAGTNGILPFGDAKRYVEGGTKYFTQQKAAAKSTWIGDKIKTTGKAGQTFFVKFPPVDLSDAMQPFVLKINNIKWQRVKNFSRSSAEDLHFTLEEKTGRINFGDNIKGKIPQQDHHIVLDYLSGKQPGFIDYYRQMKAVDPDIVILSNFEKKSFYQRMAQVNAPYDGVVKHYYPRMIHRAKKEDKYEASIVSGMKISRPIEEHKQWLNGFENSSITGKEKLWFTEYSMINVPNQMAIFHTVINEHVNDVGMLLGHSLFLNNRSAMITNNGVIRAMALPIQVFSQHLEENFIRSEVTGSNHYFKKKKLPALLSTASISNDGKTVSLVLTNTSDKYPVSTQINLNSLPDSFQAAGELWLLRAKGNNPLAENTLKEPHAISLEKYKDIKNINAHYKINIAPASVYIVKWLLK